MVLKCRGRPRPEVGTLGIAGKVGERSSWGCVEREEEGPGAAFRVRGQSGTES